MLHAADAMVLARDQTEQAGGGAGRAHAVNAVVSNAGISHPGGDERADAARIRLHSEVLAYPSLPVARAMQGNARRAWAPGKWIGQTLAARQAFTHNK